MSAFVLWWLFIGGCSTVIMVPVPYDSAARCEAAFTQIVGDSAMHHVCVPTDAKAATP